MVYLFSNGIASIIIEQYALGFALVVAFFTTLIFIVVSYAALDASCASDVTADS